MLVAAIAYHRIWFGIDYTDESFYVAIPYRFVLGDRPFVDELNLRQLAGFLTYPFVRLFVVLTGGTSGIILFTRHLYWGFQVLVLAAVVVSLRALMPRSGAILVSLLILTFTPFNIPNLSYNTLGAGLLTMGCFTSLAALVAPDQACRRMFVAGVWLGLATLSYPSLALAAAVVVAEVMHREGQFFGPLMRRATAGLLAVLCPTLVLLTLSGWDHVWHSVEYTMSTAIGGGFNKMIVLARDLASCLAHKYFLWIMAVAGLAVEKRAPLLAFGLVSALPFASFPLYGFTAHSAYASLGFVFYLAFMAPWLYFGLSGTTIARALLRAVVLPSFTAGVAIGYTSNGGYINLAVGLLPAGLSSVILLWLLLDRLVTRWGQERLGWLPSVPIVSIALMSSQLSYEGFYREDEYHRLGHSPSGGPFLGLRTTERRTLEVETLAQDLATVTRPGDRVLFHPEFPAGYLFTSLRPATCSVWISDDGGALQYYRQTGAWPDVAVKNKILPSRNRPPDRLEELIERQPFRRVVTRELYDIYRRESQRQ